LEGERAFRLRQGAVKKVRPGQDDLNTLVHHEAKSSRQRGRREERYKRGRKKRNGQKALLLTERKRAISQNTGGKEEGRKVLQEVSKSAEALNVKRIVSLASAGRRMWKGCERWQMSKVEGDHGRGKSGGMAKKSGKAKRRCPTKTR